MKKLMLSSVLILAMVAVSCSSDDDSPQDNGGENDFETPENYSFTRNSTSTVSFTGQSLRIKMVKEILGDFENFDAATETSLSNMFANENSPFSNPDLNASSKSVKSKVAASNLYFSGNTVGSNAIKSDFESYISEQTNVVFPNQNEVAEPGIAGQIADGNSTRYVNGKGLELDQAFNKGLIGALIADQALNNYLTPAVLDEADNRANNDEDITEEGAAYTTMEHKWDEAYGYVYGDASVPEENPNSVLGENEDKLLFDYIGSVDSDEDFSGIARDIFEAFKTGRAAIDASDYEARDEQVAIIQKTISKVIAVRAVHYLQGGKQLLAEGNKGGAFHDLSQGFGFVYSLRFTHNPETGAPYISADQVESFTSQLMEGNGFWDVSPETLDSISSEIASAFNFTVEDTL
jgi:hypothetical protein